MRFSVEWIDGGRNACAEERATLCDLQIFVGNENACVFYEPESRTTFEEITLPAVHLAEGIAGDWWAIFGGRDREHSLLPYRTGFALPALSFRFDGSTFEVVGKQLSCENPRLRFWRTESETLSRSDAESSLSEFIDQVVSKLADEEVTTSEVALSWSRVAESRDDPAERAFCEAAGALGTDPYSVSEPDASFIERAGDLFSQEALIEFLAGIGKSRAGVPAHGLPYHAAHPAVLRGIRHAELRPHYMSRLPDLLPAAVDIGGVTERRPYERAWAPAYRAARALRRAIGAQTEEALSSTRAISGKLGARRFKRTNALADVSALTSRDEDDFHIHLRDHGTRKWARWAENFAFGRAIGSAVCFPETERSVVNDLHDAERQAAGRAFAAEFLAPVNKVLDMDEQGCDVDEISGAFNVSSQVILHQLENRDRIRQACAAQNP